MREGLLCSTRSCLSTDSDHIYLSSHGVASGGSLLAAYGGHRLSLSNERKIPCSNPAFAGIFSGLSHTSDGKIGTPVATLPEA